MATITALIQQGVLVHKMSMATVIGQATNTLQDIIRRQ